MDSPDAIEVSVRAAKRAVVVERLTEELIRDIFLAVEIQAIEKRDPQIIAFAIRNCKDNAKKMLEFIELSMLRLQRDYVGYESDEKITFSQDVFKRIILEEIQRLTVAHKKMRGEQ
jgi:hypothetical protein